MQRIFLNLKGETKESDRKWAREVAGWKRPGAREAAAGTGQHKGQPEAEGRRGKY